MSSLSVGWPNLHLERDQNKGDLVTALSPVSTPAHIPQKISADVTGLLAPSYFSLLGHYGPGVSPTSLLAFSSLISMKELGISNGRSL